MSINSRLTGLFGMVALASVTPAMAKGQAAQPSTNHVQSVETSYIQTGWGYSGGLLGTGISFAGKGLSLVGEGISWTFEKGMIPVRKTGEVSKTIGDTLAKGPEWVEDKTGIPMQTPASILRSPGNIVFSLTDNGSDLLKDMPKASLGMVGSSLGLVGNSIGVDTNGIARAAKDLGSHSLAMGMTIGGDALPIGLQATGFMFGFSGLPYDAIARDGLAAAHRTTDLITGQSDLSKPVPKNIFSASKYTYDRIKDGKGVADAKGGRFFAGDVAISEKDTKTAKISPELLKAQQNKLSHGG